MKKQKIIAENFTRKEVTKKVCGKNKFSHPLGGFHCLNN